MTEHKHACFFRAIADGVPMKEFEVHFHDWDGDHWEPLDTGFLTPIHTSDGRWKIRRKPKTLKIGDFDVPEPVREGLASDQQYWTPNIHSPEMPYPCDWIGRLLDFHYLKAGMIHLTREPAVIHGRALRSFTEAK